MKTTVRFIDVRTFFVLTAVVAMAACASGGAGGEGDAPRRGTQNRIIEAELNGYPQLNALQAIERLRPRWLRQSLNRVPVPVINGSPQVSAGLGVLETIRASDLQEMRYMSASDATTRYGTGYGGGAILVETKRGGDG